MPAFVALVAETETPINRRSGLSDSVFRIGGKWWDGEA